MICDQSCIGCNGGKGTEGGGHGADGAFPPQGGDGKRLGWEKCTLRKWLNEDFFRTA